MAFVKATGEFGDPLKGNLPPRDENDAAVDPAAPIQQLTEAQQQQQQPPPGDSSASRHAGLGFSNRSNAKPNIPGSANNASPQAAASQTTATPYQPSRAAPLFPDTTVNAFDFDYIATNDGHDDDEVNALLAAFPGSKELGPGESMIEDDDASVSWSLPAFQPKQGSRQAMSHRNRNASCPATMNRSRQL